MKDKEIKHLEFIQNIIFRMNTNSFQIKGMAIAIVSALLAVYASEKNPDFILITIFPLVLFWFLDSYYLTQERRYTGLYNDLIKGNRKDLGPFEISVKGYKKREYNYWWVLFSVTIWTLYLIILFAIVIIYSLLMYK